MITAEEFFRQKLKEQSPIREVITLSQELITAEQGMRWGYEYSILKAKFHVEEALKQASEKFDADCNKYAVLNAYPLTNIK